MKDLQISFIRENEKKANEFASILESQGYKIKTANNEVSESSPVMLIFYKGASKERMLKDISWLRSQNERSSIKYLRLFPIFLFDKESDIEKDIDSYVDVYEDFISGEFKPYGFVLDEPSKYIAEFNRVLNESYSE